MQPATHARADETVIERKTQIVEALVAALDERDRDPPRRHDEKAELDEYLRDLVDQLSGLRAFLPYDSDAQKALDREIETFEERIAKKPAAAARRDQ